MERHSWLTGLDEIRSNWGWFLTLGIALIALGFIALSAVSMSTVVSALMFGWLLVFSGIFEATASLAGRWNGFLLNLFVGLLYVVGGVLILFHPVASAVGLTLVMAALFLTGGLFRILGAAMLRYRNWGWAVFDGVVSVIAGALIWKAWPSSSLWVLGTLLGVILLFRGWSWVMFALSARQLPAVPKDRDASERMRPAA